MPARKTDCSGRRRGPLAETYDAVVVGAGHNALISAAYLAVAGLSVVVLERAAYIGGDAATEECTLPGFRHDSCSSAHTVIQQNPLLRHDELGLANYGLQYLRPDPVYTLPFPDGAALTMYLDPERTVREIARYSRHDAEAYRALLNDWQHLQPLQAAERNNPPRPPEEFAALWRSGVLGDEGYRIRMATGVEIIRERFEHPYVQAFIAWVATMTLEPIDEVGTGILPFSLTAGRQQNSWTTPVGGSGALPEALARLIQAHGGTIHTHARVERILLDAQGRAEGVTLSDGRTFYARRAIVSSQHVTELPRSLPDAIDPQTRRYIERWRAGLTMFVTHYALSEAPRYRTPDGSVSAVAMGRLSSLDHLLELLTAFRLGRVVTDDPFLLVINSSLVDASRAPEGKHTLKIVGIQPYALPDGPEAWDRIKEDVSEALLDAYLPLTTNLRRTHILARHIESPLDLERRNPNNFRGSCHGGAYSHGQFGYFRPAPRWSGYRTPIPGLYLTGSTTHPGGSISGYPGRNAARAVLQDLGISFEDVIQRAQGRGA